MKITAWVLLFVGVFLGLAASQVGGSACPSGCALLQMPWDILKCQAWQAVCPSLVGVGQFVITAFAVTFLVLAVWKFNKR